MRNYLYILIFLLAFPLKIYAQEGYVNRGIIIGNDTVSHIILPAVYIVSPPKFKNKREEIRYTRLVRYVKKVYPYAKLAGEKLQVYDSLLRSAKNESEKKRLMKQAESEIRDEYEGKLRDLTIMQGKILVKLIDRETSQTSYELLKELRGNVNAILWQGLGKLFGYNLKVKYDPTGEDYQIERIVRLIELGAI